MKSKFAATLTVTILTASLLFSSGCATESQQALAAQATVSREQAQQTALSKAPGGTVKEVELEKEHGRLIWSFDIATPGDKDITEVQVDARTGEIVTVEKESPADQAKEKKKDAK